MVKGIFFVDWLLFVLFIFMILSKFLNLENIKIFQLVFFILIFIHILQHWKSFFYSFRRLFKKTN